REEVLLSATHLVELDLLRGGERLPTLEALPPGDYYAFVCRGQRRFQAEGYARPMRRPLPPVPAPLSGAHPDVAFALQVMFPTVYDRAGYDYSLDYRRALMPPLSEADLVWAQQLLGRGAL